MEMLEAQYCPFHFYKNMLHGRQVVLMRSYHTFLSLRCGINGSRKQLCCRHIEQHLHIATGKRHLTVYSVEAWREETPAADIKLH